MKKDELGTVDYRLNGKTYELFYKQHDWRNIISIFLLREIDKEREVLLNMERLPLHYRQFSRDWPGVNY